MAADLRRLGVDDVEAYRAIRLHGLKTAPEAFGSTYEIESTRALSEFADRLEATATFGAFVKGEIVGMVGFWQSNGPRERHKGRIFGTYVKPEARGSGAGRALMGAVLAHAAGIVEQVTLFVVEDNADAIALYRRVGFTVFGVEPRALKMGDRYQDEYLMIRYLTAE